MPWRGGPIPSSECVVRAGPLKHQTTAEQTRIGRVRASGGRGKRSGADHYCHASTADFMAISIESSSSRVDHGSKHRDRLAVLGS